MTQRWATAWLVRILPLSVRIWHCGRTRPRGISLFDSVRWEKYMWSRDDLPVISFIMVRQRNLPQYLDKYLEKHADKLRGADLLGSGEQKWTKNALEQLEISVEQGDCNLWCQGRKDGISTLAMEVLWVSAWYPHSSFDQFEGCDGRI